MVKSFLLLLGVLQAFAVLAGTGPRLSSRAFFSEHVKLDSPGLEDVRAAVAQDDVAGAERAFGTFVRGYLAKRAAAARKSRVTDPKRIAVLKERAERTMGNEFVVCRTPYRFADGKIDWEFNPTYNGYKEWTYQFSRHEFLIDLADYYLATGDERAAESYVRILSSWMDQAQVPLAASPYDTHCWRTIEAGLRMMPECWVHQLEAFVSSPAVTDAFLTAYFRSVCEHGWRLVNNPTTGNWFTHQLLGLASISVNYPFLSDAPKWREYSVGRFAEQSCAQVYPDGFQYELSTGYHIVVLRQYLELADVFRRSGEPIPAFIGEAVRPMVGALVALRRPDGQTPPLNDGGCVGVDGAVRAARDFLPKDFKTALDHSSVLPYSGAVTFRSGSGRRDVWGYLDAGPFGRAHQHEDKLNFLLSAYGRDMVVEAGTYDYDESDMRRYVVSTRAHNTVLFDGLCQNRYAGGEWKNPDLKKKADMEFFTSPGCDAAEAKFDEGYGPTRQGFTHARKVLFRRDVEGMTPFFVIVDRLTAPDGKPHRFEIPWHLEECALRLAGNGFKADFGGGVGLVGAVSDVGATLKDRRGSRMPDYQGWLPIRKAGPHEHQPIPTPVAEGCFTGSVRVVTVLYPYEGTCPLRAVQASSDPHDERYVLRLADGRLVESSESVYPSPLVFEVKTDRPDALYARGEKATFHVTACWTNGLRATTGRVIAKLDDTGTNSVSRQAVDLLENNPFRVEGTLGSPGFLRLTLQARGTSPKCWSAGYEPEKIVKGSPSPTDFEDFWRESRAKLAREVPLDPQIEKVPERSKPGFDFYRISFATFGRRVYGFLSIPTDRTKAPYPVRVQVSAAGFGGWTNEMSGNADEIRAFFAVMPWAPDFDWAKKGLMSNYHAMNDGYVKRYGCKYQQAGISESREAYFFYPVLLGIDRAVDWIAARPDVDPKRFCYYGVSQGGGFGFYLCALNRHFTRGAVFVPALTDILGYKAGRISGWPTLIENQRPENRAAAERNAPYFDAANFASRICCPFCVVMGFSDTTCPPPAIYAAYNAIPGPDKRIYHGLGMGHGVGGRFSREVNEFLFGRSRTPEAENVLETLRTIGDSRKYIVAWTHPWLEGCDACAERTPDGGWRAKPLDRTVLNGYVSELTGKDPFLYSTDFYCCLGTWENQAIYARNMANMEGFIKKAYDLWGAVPIFSWHIENPYATAEGVKDKMASGCPYRYRYSCASYPQEHKYVLREIVTGTGGVCGGGRSNAAEELGAETFPDPKAWYDAQLDKVCAFLKRLTDRNGRPIPVVIRPFHECEDDWSWWGGNSSTYEDYIAAFRYTVDEIRRRTGLESLLFLYSPDRYWNTEDDFMCRYPGDDVVDMIGFDDYSVGTVPKDWTGDAEDGVNVSLEGTIRRMRIVSDIARRKGKVAGLMETGVEFFEGTGLSEKSVSAYELIRKAMTAEGVSFAFFNTWGGANTVPKSDYGKKAWQSFLDRPESLTAGKGYVFGNLKEKVK